MKPKLIISLVVLVAVGAGIGYTLIQQAGNRPPASDAQTTPAIKTNVVDVTVLKSRAEAGDPAAQTALARAYLDGNGVKASSKEAARLLQLAADQNYPDALATLGELTQAGQGVPQNIAAAVQLYQRAADAGSVAGQYNLAYLYEQGTGVKASETEAAKWYELAAAGGDPIAQFDIGQRYDLGVGVSKNPVKAYKWLALASAQGQADSIKLLTQVKAELSSEDLVLAQQLVADFKPRPAPSFTITNIPAKPVTGN